MNQDVGSSKNSKMAEEFQERQVAFKTNIDTIKTGKYFTKEGWEPNYLLTNTNQKISRVNLMGVVIDKEINGAMVNLGLDDGSGSIKLRSFEEIKNINSIELGSTVLVIGKLRVYNEEKYIAPEIIKKIDQEWLKARKKELEKKPIEKEEPIVDEVEFEDNFDSDNKKIVELIKQMDSGDGVLIETIKTKANIPQIDELIEKMLKEGEIFQNLPGKVKVL